MHLADEKCKDFVLIAEELLDIDVTAFKYDILQRQTLIYYLLRILFREISDVYHCRMGAFLSFNI